MNSAGTGTFECISYREVVNGNLKQFVYILVVNTIRSLDAISGGAYQDARRVSIEWNDIQNIGPHLNADAAGTKP